MDGFAIRAGDAPGVFAIVGEVLMGRQSIQPVTAGGAMRIPTGGTLPLGADAVVPIEDVKQAGERIEIGKTVTAGDCVTPAGADMKSGDTILRRGRELGAAEIGVLATLGIIAVRVYRRPIFGVLSSGDELIEPSQMPSPGEIRDSNRFAVAAALQAMGVDARHYPTAADRPDALRSVLENAVRDCDGVVLTGGSSVGERDFTPRIVAELGSPGVLVHGLRVKPGKPTVLAAIGDKPIFGLPGNPVSALMILEAVLRPLIAALTGDAWAPPAIPARAEEIFRGCPGWTWFVPVGVRREGFDVVARPLPIRSALSSLLTSAAGFVTLGENHGSTAVGDLVYITPFSSGGRW